MADNARPVPGAITALTRRHRAEHTYPTSAWESCVVVILEGGRDGYYKGVEEGAIDNRKKYRSAHRPNNELSNILERNTFSPEGWWRNRAIGARMQMTIEKWNNSDTKTPVAKSYEEARANDRAIIRGRAAASG